MAFSNDPALNEAEKLKSRCNEILVIAIYLVLVSTVLCKTFFLNCPVSILCSQRSYLGAHAFVPLALQQY